MSAPVGPRWARQILWRMNSPAILGGRMVLGGQAYTYEESEMVAEWLAERAAGYPPNPVLAEWPVNYGS